jgi:aspartyl-tRNA(Asn)/glutamyl-tRNA(Gln) amidotransferase subunit B
LDDEKLTSALGGFEMAEEEEVKSTTGQMVGTVHPFVNVTRKLVDQRILENDTLSFTTGNPMEGVIIPREDFLSALEKYEVVDICSDPEEHLVRLASTHGIERHDAKFLVESESLGYFESIVDALGSSVAMEWLRNLVRYANVKGKDFTVVKPEWLVEIVRTELTDFAKKDLLLKTIDREAPPVVKKEAADLESVVQKVLNENAKAVQQYKDGDEKVLNFLVGQAMRASRGAFDPRDVHSKLLERLGLSK